MFSAGDVVRVKSGGPKMTVAYIEGGLAYCVWFISDRQESGSFLLSVLVRE